MDAQTRLALKISTFLANPTAAFVEQNPEMLGPPAGALLQKMAKGLKSDGQLAQAKLYDECRVLFHLCKKIGAGKAFALHKGYLTAGSELRELLGDAEAKVALAQLAPSPEAAAAASLACRSALGHPRFPNLSRSLQLELLLKASGANILLGQATGGRESLEHALELVERALPLAEPGSEMLTYLLSNREAATELLAAAGEAGSA